MYFLKLVTRICFLVHTVFCTFIAIKLIAGGWIYFTEISHSDYEISMLMTSLWRISLFEEKPVYMCIYFLCSSFSLNFSLIFSTQQRMFFDYMKDCAFYFIYAFLPKSCRSPSSARRTSTGISEQHYYFSWSIFFSDQFFVNCSYAFPRLKCTIEWRETFRTSECADTLIKAEYVSWCYKSNLGCSMTREEMELEVNLQTFHQNLISEKVKYIKINFWRTFFVK